MEKILQQLELTNQIAAVVGAAEEEEGYFLTISDIELKKRPGITTTTIT